MPEPSTYERQQWLHLTGHRERPTARTMHAIGDGVASAFRGAGHGASRLAARYPAVRRAQQEAAGVARAVGDKVPDRATDLGKQWVVAGLDGATRAVSKVSRAGLSPERVVKKHQNLGHPVTSLSDIRDIDLEQVDKVRGRFTDLLYSVPAALSGGGAALVISGGEIAGTFSGGALAAPGFGAIAGALAADAAVVTGLSSRAVGTVAMTYGYDPEDPAEKLFILSVINAGTALTAAGKAAAMRDLSRVSQALFRKATWVVLEESVIAQVYQRAAVAMTGRFTKKALGKFVPVAGVVLGASLNYATLDSIVDAANIAYRRRFLLEKYPQLADSHEQGDWLQDAEIVTDVDPGDSDIDDVFSVLTELEDLGVDTEEPHEPVASTGPETV